MTGTKSKWAAGSFIKLDSRSSVTKSFVFFLSSHHSFFLGELEKCLEDPDRLATLFVKQVKHRLTLRTSIFFHFLIPSAVFIFSALFFSAVILTTFKCLYSFQHESSSLSYIF